MSKNWLAVGAILGSLVVGAYAEDTKQAPAPSKKIADGQAQPEKGKGDLVQQGILSAVDLAANTITLVSKENQKEGLTLRVAKSATIAADGKVGQLSDLKTGYRVFVKLSDDRQEVVSIKAGGNAISGELKAVALDSITLVGKKSEAGKPTDRVFPLAKNVKIHVSGKDTALNELKVNTNVSLTLAVDGKTVAVVAQGGKEGEKKTDGVAKDGDKKPEAVKKDGEKKPEAKGDGEKKPAPKDGDKKPEAVKKDGEKKPEGKPDGVKKPAPKDGDKKPEAVKKDGEKKPEAKGDGEKKPAPKDGDKKPEAVKKDGEKKPEGKPDGEKKPAPKDGDKKPEAVKKDGEKKPEGKGDGEKKPAPKDGDKKPEGQG